MEKKLTREQKTVHELSQMIVKAQRPICILNSLKWNETIREDFFKNPDKLPKLDKDYYKTIKIGFDPIEKMAEFENIKQQIQKKLGVISPLAELMQRICQEYKLACRLIMARGTPDFANYSHRLYGGSDDAFYLGGPTLYGLSQVLNEAIPNLGNKTNTEADEKKYTAKQAVQILQEKINSYFNDPSEKIKVELSDNIVSDAAAGSEVLKINKDSKFSDRDIRLLEVHEGWVHLGTTLNGRQQPICTFLSKGPPSATTSQEGLAILMEIFTHSSFPGRIKRLNDRIIAINMVENGANFIDVIRYFTEQGHSLETSYLLASRVFRGALPDGSAGAFSKDLSYTKGFVLIYNYIRLAIRQGKIEYIPFLFVGKASLSDLKLLHSLQEQGFVEPPKYIPEPIKDISAISAWLSFSLFMNKIDLNIIERDFQNIF